jgi:YjbE family integral membrane protein
VGLLYILPTPPKAKEGPGLDSLATHPHMTGGFFLNSLGIILINIVLSGDNSVVIAMAVHELPKKLRIRGILIGTLGAVLLRVLFTLIASHLMEIPFLKLVGGLAVLWIAVKLLVEDEAALEGRSKPASIWHAVWIILVADLTMSIDNVLAVAGMAHGNMIQLWLSLGLSIPLVVFASTLLSSLMDRFPVILLLGAALLGKVGGEMIITDPAMENWFHASKLPALHWGFQILTTAGVLWAAWRIRRRRPAATALTAAAPGAEADAADPGAQGGDAQPEP